MDSPEKSSNGPAKVFSEAEWRASARDVVAHAAATGSAVLADAKGTPQVYISIPPAEPFTAE